MSSFNEPLTVTKVKDNIWRVERGFRYFVGALGSDDAIDVPYGFETDFASVPRGLWNIFPPDGQYAQAAVLHDYLYNQHGNVPEGKNRPRKECDGIFLEAMEVLNVSWIKRHLMYRAVRIFGGIPWGKK